MPTINIEKSSKDNIRAIIKDALELSNDVQEMDYRLEAFKIILSKLIDNELGLPHRHAHLNKTPVPTQMSDGGDGELMEDRDVIPSITSTGSAPGNIMALFDLSWGQKRRKVDGVRAALDANNVPDPKITQTLNRLVDQKKLRSFKQDGELVYWKNPDYKPE